MPGRIGQIGHHLNGFPPNMTNSTTQFDQASSQWISTQFDQASSQWISTQFNRFDQASSQWISTQFDHPIRPGIISMDFHPFDHPIQPGIISMDFHPI